MATAKQRFFSIVLVGGQNPQILNHDFLVANSVLPDTEPFVCQKGKEKDNPFTDFFSSPPVARIAYGNYSILVQQDRYQAMDTTGADPTQTPIIGITKKYFGGVLEYTPFTLGGLNLNCELTFKADEERKLDELLGVDHNRVRHAFACDNAVVSSTTAFPFLAGRLLIGVAKPKEADKPSTVNFNYEFPYPGNMKEFLANLDFVTKLVEYRCSFYDRIGVSK